MTSFLPTTSPLSNPAGRSFRQHNIWRKSQPVCTQWRMIQNQTSCLDDSLRLFPPFFPLQTVMAEQNLWSWSLDMSPPSPQIAGLLIKAPFFSTDTCLSNYWHMSCKQPNLGSVTNQPVCKIILNISFVCWCLCVCLFLLPSPLNVYTTSQKIWNTPKVRAKRKFDIWWYSVTVNNCISCHFIISVMDRLPQILAVLCEKL